jgi:hypothetical protein
MSRYRAHWLPAAPLVAWMADHPDTEAVLAARSGVPKRRLQALRQGEQQHVTFNVADRLLTRNDARLDDVWPDIDRLLGLEDMEVAA